MATRRVAEEARQIAKKYQRISNVGYMFTAEREALDLALTVQALYEERDNARAELCNGHKALTAAGVSESDQFGKLSVTGRVVRLKERLELLKEAKG